MTLEMLGLKIKKARRRQARRVTSATSIAVHNLLLHDHPGIECHGSSSPENLEYIV